eukprot:6728086-Pyramimonas_sp.AAC.1
MIGRNDLQGGCVPPPHCHADADEVDNKPKLSFDKNGHITVSTKDDEEPHELQTRLTVQLVAAHAVELCQHPPNVQEWRKQ